jgi:hypothetical protein
MACIRFLQPIRTSDSLYQHNTPIPTITRKKTCVKPNATRICRERGIIYEKEHKTACALRALCLTLPLALQGPFAWQRVEIKFFARSSHSSLSRWLTISLLQFRIFCGITWRKSKCPCRSTYFENA